MAESHGAQTLFWSLASELTAQDPRVVEGTIMRGRCLRLGKAFLALPDFKGSGMVVKLSRERVQALINQGVGEPFGPGNRVFREWVSIPRLDRVLWKRLLQEAIALAERK